MNKSALKVLESQLVRQTYSAIAKKLRPLSSRDLLALLDSKSIKIGDTAGSFMDRRSDELLLVNALLNAGIRSALGRVRATNILLWRGRKAPEAIRAYVHCLDDRSDHVLSNALFGIVFMKRHDLLPELKERMLKAPAGSQRRRRLREAIRALKANNPFLYSPGFADPDDIWGLGDSHLPESLRQAKS